MVKKTNTKKRELCTCVICKNNQSFSMPKEIIEAVRKKKLVIFAGAGVSTESKPTFPYTLYDDISFELELDKDNYNLDFPELMSKYCKLPDGRKKLLQKIRERIDYVDSFPEIYLWATRFHRELSTIHFIDEIVTTNWDDYFERECGAIPIVIPEDFAFWDTPGRKVFKIHGSINNYGSIVATTEDYNKCYRKLKSDVIGSYLKLLLATKTILFIGYSFNDFDFNKIYTLLKKEMKDILPHSYVVTIDEKSANKFVDMNITPIITDATYFISNLKDHLTEHKLMIDDKRFRDVLKDLKKVELEHGKLQDNIKIKERPEVIYACFYQDGLIHAFQRMISKINTGSYSCGGCLTNLIYRYLDIRNEKLRNKKYDDVAYIDGYISGLAYILWDDDERSKLPLYYIYGYKGDIISFNEFKKILKEGAIFHKAAYKYAKKIADELEPLAEIHHTAFLL